MSSKNFPLDLVEVVMSVIFTNSILNHYRFKFNQVQLADITWFVWTCKYI